MMTSASAALLICVQGLLSHDALMVDISTISQCFKIFQMVSSNYSLLFVRFLSFVITCISLFVARHVLYRFFSFSKNSNYKITIC